jgi:lysophospholipase L1-like esterase
MQPNLTRGVLAVFVLSVSLAAQQPSALSRAQASLDEWRKSRAALLMDDFGELARYREANVALKPPVAGDNRVIFFGDSITDMWKLSDYFSGKPYVNRGIGGQTTSQMLIRFREDVIELRPKVVVILAGTNDIAGNTGPMTLDEIEANYSSMAQLAHANRIQVVLSSVLPVHNYTPESEMFFPTRSPAKILELNRWLKDYCAANHHLYLDYFTAMVDEKGYLKRNLADDGLHPNAEGYKVMTPLAESAIRKSLQGKALSAR